YSPAFVKFLYSTTAIKVFSSSNNIIPPKIDVMYIHIIHLSIENINIYYRNLYIKRNTRNVYSYITSISFILSHNISKCSGLFIKSTSFILTYKTGDWSYSAIHFSYLL